MFIALLVSASPTVTDDSLAISAAILILLGGWVTLAIAAKRLHDRNRTAWVLLTSVLLVPIVWLVFELWLVPGTVGANRLWPGTIGRHELTRFEGWLRMITTAARNRLSCQAVVLHKNTNQSRTADFQR